MRDTTDGIALLILLGLIGMHENSGRGFWTVFGILAFLILYVPVKRALCWLTKKQ